MCIRTRRAGRGVAAVRGAGKTRRRRGAKSLTVDASDTAEGFFARRGYVGKQRNTVTLNGEWLANTTMEKSLAAPGVPT